MKNFVEERNQEQTSTKGLDAKADNPAAVMRMETLLVHKELMENGSVNELLIELQTKGMKPSSYRNKLPED
ncbi:Aldehyde dehydrogenase, C-terminal [Artemisia annua]|uniref:Aldehyde dehydrogenase, C-terminal n=1 Tax=Artemisia annua TaxID=35608 RepID=A0A2U1ML27_ARTAN|nr:Aldehyde dehydrogenase, C-terminal [Artemisia annua]